MVSAAVEERRNALRERRATQGEDAAPRVTRSVSIEVEKPLIDSLPKEPEKETKEETKPLVYKPGVLVRPLTGIYEMLGGFIILGDKECGQAVIDSAENCAQALDELARTDPKVRKVLMRLVQSGAWSKVLFAHLPIFLVIMAHHFPNALKYVMHMITGMQRMEAEQ